MKTKPKPPPPPPQPRIIHVPPDLEGIIELRPRPAPEVGWN